MPFLLLWLKRCNEKNKNTLHQLRILIRHLIRSPFWYYCFWLAWTRRYCAGGASGFYWYRSYVPLRRALIEAGIKRAEQVRLK